MNSRKLCLLTLALLMLFSVAPVASAQGSSTDAKKVTVTLVRWPYT